MIELPEALTIARQMDAGLKGKRIASATCGSSPHKFAFYTRSPDEYAAILKDKTLGQVTADGSHILASLGPDYLLRLGGGGERILFHRSEKTLPKKHQLLLRFEEEPGVAGATYLTVTVQGWGAVQLFHQSEIAGHPYAGKRGVSPLSDAFTFECLQGLFEDPEEKETRSVKAFAISKPGIWGLGNGYLQDILFRARIHPKRRAADLSEAEKRALYEAVRSTLQQAADLGGRDTERDLYNRRGGYVRILDSRTKGQPCPACGTPIEKIQYLGGASYFCPTCQV